MRGPMLPSRSKAVLHENPDRLRPAPGKTPRLHAGLARFLPAIDRDVLVLAGDVGAGMSARHFIEREVHISPVIYVPGNHEYHTPQPREDLDQSWRALAANLPGLHYLAGDAVVIGGARFWGAPWYSDLFGRRDASHLNWINGVVTDFQAQPGDESPWTIGRHLETHWLQTESLLEQPASWKSSLPTGRRSRPRCLRDTGAIGSPATGSTTARTSCARSGRSYGSAATYTARMM